MRNYFILLSISIVLVAISACNNESKTVNETKTEIVESTKVSSEITINLNGIGEIKIGDDYDLARKYFEKLNFKATQIGGKVEQNDAGLYIYKDTNLVVLIGNKNWGLSPFIVKNIKIYSEDFKTQDNIHVGMNLKDLIKMFPDAKFDQDEETGSFYICPEKYQTKQKTGEPNVVFMITIRLNNEADQKKSVDALNKNISALDGAIDYISIYDWN